MLFTPTTVTVHVVSPQVDSAEDMVVAELKAAMQDLSSELQEERRAGLETAQQFAHAKAAWAVERSELRSLISRVRVRAWG